MKKIAKLLLWIAAVSGARFASADELPKLDPALVKRADAYIISVVGLDYFQKNYEFVPEASTPVNSDPPHHWSVMYRYRPLQRVAPESKGYVSIYVDTAGRMKPEGYVACIRDTKVVEPTITSAKALELVKAAGVDTAGYRLVETQVGYPGFNEPDGTGGWNAHLWHWIFIYASDQGACVSYRFVQVDLFEGRVSWSNGAICE